MAFAWTDNPAALCTRDARMWGLRGAMFLILLGSGVIWIYAGIWMKDHGIGETAIGILIGLGGATASGMGLLWGWLSDHTGRSTQIVSAGCVLTGLSLIVLAHSGTLISLALFQLLAAAGLSATMTLMPLLAMALIGDSAPGSGYGRFRLFGSIGYMFGLYVLATTLPALNLLFLVSGCLIVLGVVPLMLANVQPRRHVERHGFGGLLRRPRFVWFLGAVFVSTLGHPGVFTFLSIYAKELGMTQRGVACLMGMCGVVALVGLPIMGSLADRIGADWVLLLAFVAMPARLLAQAVITTPSQLYVSQLLHILTWAAPEATMYIYITRLVGDQDKGVGISAYVTVRTVSQLVANPVVGYLAEHHGYRAMFLTVAAVSAAGPLVFLFGSWVSRAGMRGGARLQTQGGRGGVADAPAQ